MKKKLFVLFAFLYSPFVWAADITAALNRSPLPQGEVSMLTLTVEGNVSNQPDLSVLEPNFKVYSTSVSHQSYIINGQGSTTTRFQIGIMPLMAGRQQIPSISIGTDKSAPIDVEVVSADTNLPLGQTPDASSAQSAGTYAIRAEVLNMPKNYYVQQELNYNVILTDEGGLQGGEPFFENNAGEWLILSLGEPDVITQTSNGKPQRIITFKYALFAQKSGRLKIPAVNFDGYALNNPDNFFTLDLNNPLGVGFGSLLDIRKPVSLRAPEQSIDVLQAPSDTGGWWLPAKNVTLKSKLLTDPSKIKQGEPFDRQITLEAEGLSSTQLPEINFPSSSDFKQYPQKSTSTNLLRGGFITGQKKIQNTYVPERAGILKLPEISVEFFDVNTGKTKKAILQSQTLHVLPNETLSPVEENVGQNALEPVLVKDSVSQKENSFEKEKTLNIGLLILIAFGAFLAGLFLSAYLFKKSPSKPQCETRRFPKYIVEKAYQNDYRALRDGLISWADGFYPQKTINNLNDVADAVDLPEFREQIALLIQNLYGNTDAETFNAKVFADSFKKAFKKRPKKTDKKEPLPPLYD